MQEKETNLAAKIAAVSGELIAIPKTRNPQSEIKYAYRSIDDVMNAINPILEKHKLAITLNVLDRKLTPVQSSKGTPGYAAEVLCELNVTDGKETITTQEWALSVDYSDKAPTQAMSMAYKYALIRMFVVTTKDLIENDADRRSPELPQQPTEKQLMEMFLAELAKVNLDKVFIGLNKNATTEKYNRWKNASDKEAVLKVIINELKIIQGDVKN